MVRNMWLIGPECNQETWTHQLHKIIARSTPVVRLHLRFKIIPTYMYLYYNISRNWRWHYMGFAWSAYETAPIKPLFLPHIVIIMGFTLVDSSNCPFKATVLPHIGIIWVPIWSAHEVAHVKLHFATHWYYVALTLVSPWNGPSKAIVCFFTHRYYLGIVATI